MISRRRFLQALALTPALGLIRPQFALALDNPLVLENSNPGSSGWLIPNPGYVVTSESTREIQGYASSTSVNAGDALDLFVHVNKAQSFTVDVYRLGWYAGVGGRSMGHFGPFAGVVQPAPVAGAAVDAPLECRWSRSATLDVPTGWTSGIYVAVLSSAAKYQNYVVFAVRDDARVADFLYQQPVTTYNAYNRFAGKGLYTSPKAHKVSFDRPYLRDGAGDLFRWEINFIRWMERSGYDVKYSTSLDTHLHPEQLLLAKAFLSAGHDEYWTWEMFDAAERARDTGHDLAFFGANAVYWQIRLEPSSLGIPNRTVVCYKGAQDPVQGSRATKMFRQVGRAEQPLLGIQYGNLQGRNYPFVVDNATHWVYAGTGLVKGQSLPQLVGYESDRSYSTYRLPTALSRTLLSSSPVVRSNGQSSVSHSCIYQAPSGAWVFTAGTLGWSWALDSFGGWAPVQPGLQRATANILSRFVA